MGLKPRVANPGVGGSERERLGIAGEWRDNKRAMSEGDQLRTYTRCMEQVAHAFKLSFLVYCVSRLLATFFGVGLMVQALFRV